MGTEEARRYCAVCGYLSSEPMTDCPRCSQASAHIPAAQPAPLYEPAPWSPAAPTREVPAWLIFTIIVVVAFLVLVTALYIDGAFNAPSSLLASLAARSDATRAALGG